MNHHLPGSDLRIGIAEAFGVTASSRLATVSSMFEADLSSSVGYWFQLVVSMIIATLGLVLNSVAVVIGAMLVSPLMSPIVRSGMALAIGSPLLAIRSLSRVALSVVVVILSAAVLTLLLPFNEVTTEIAARTTPTLLDLIVAGCCALAAAYTAIKPGSETAATAAGTAIGIALVPPLCVVGFGLGTARMDVAAGATLLFTANLCAILLVAVVMFLLLGYDQLDVDILEGKDLSGSRASHPGERTARLLHRIFGSRYSRALRVLMPLVLLVSVYVPLRRALAEVTWQVKVRSGIQHLLEDMELARDSVRTQLTVEKSSIVVRLIVLGSSAEALRLQEALKTRIAAMAGIIPEVAVIPVPDETAWTTATQAAEKERTAPVPHPLGMDAALGRVDKALRAHWPQREAGALLSWSLSTGGTSQLVLSVWHLGRPPGSAAADLLGSLMSLSLEHSVQVDIHSLSPDVIRPKGELDLEWTSAVTRTIVEHRLYDPLFLYVEQIPQPSETHSTKKKGENRVNVLGQFLEASLEGVEEARVCRTYGTELGVRLSLEPCPEQPVSTPAPSTPEAPGDAPRTP